MSKKQKPGRVPEGKLGVYSYDSAGRLNLRGHVGLGGTAATCARFHGQHGSTLGVVAGRKAWIAPKRRKS